LESGSNTITVLGDGNDNVTLQGNNTSHWSGPTPLASDPTHFTVYQTTTGPAATVIIANTIDASHVVTQA